ncbi:MAG: NHL repeat-containing protein [Candidatus Acidiferrales bacterium]
MGILKIKEKARGWARSIRDVSSGILTVVLSSCVVCAVVSCSRPQAAAQSAPPPAFQYLGEWGTSGNEPGQLQDPRTLSTDAVGNVYIADDGKPVQVEKFDSLGHPLLVFDVTGIQNDWDIAVDSGQAIFLVDVSHAQIHIYSPEGEVFRTLFFRYRRDFSDPTSIAMESGGDFYLADFETGRIALMNPRGRTLEAWSKPFGMPVKKWAPFRIRLGLDGNLYVADAANQKIDKLSADGHYMASWDFPFSDSKTTRDAPKAYGLAVFQNFVTASDLDKRLLSVWTLDGQQKLTVDFSQHPEWGENTAPTDIAFTPKGELLVLDRPDSRVLRFKINVAE